MTQRNSSTNIQNPKFWILFLFTIFFLLRVLVHFFVRIISVEWFPPESEWLSGALPYQYLLASQILVLFSLFKVCRDFWYRSGYFYKPNNFLTYWLLPIGITYLFIDEFRRKKQINKLFQTLQTKEMDLLFLINLLAS